MPSRQCPGWQCRNTLRLLMLVQFDPHLSEVVKVTAETKTATGPLKGLGLRTRHSVLIISPLFTTAAVASDTADGHGAGHQHLPRLDGLVFLQPDYRRDGVDCILPGPATRSDNFVQPVRISTRISVRCDAALGAVAACCRNKPFHVLRRKRLFKTQQSLRIVLRLFHN